MSEFINTIVLLGDDAVIDSIIERTITEFKDNVITSVGAYAFYGCTALTNVDLPSVTSIGANAFQTCSALIQMILRGSTVCTLGSSALASTPIASGTGYIYVPAALIDSYKAATNWSTYADRFRALEDYTVDGTTTGEIDETLTGGG